MQQQDGMLIDNPTNKMQMFYDYYKTLYTAELVSAQKLDNFFCFGSCAMGAGRR